jgi:RNA polymerase sigma-70 factor (ECF subfamily)
VPIPTRPIEPPPGGSDEELAGRAAGGEREAFEVLLRRYAPAVVAVVEAQVGDHHLALDLAQEVWLKVYRGLAGFETERRFRPWLFSIALNCARDSHRRETRTRVVYLDEYRDPPHAHPSSDPSGRAEERAVIASALARVVEPYRTAVQLVDVLGLSYEEAALSLRCSLGTVKSRVNRGRLAFRDHYARLEGERDAAAFRPGSLETTP